MQNIDNLGIEKLAAELVNKLIDKKLSITAAESCTGGLVASYITSVSGSSSCFNGSFVTYSNEMKTKMIGVSVDTLEKHGAVSNQCVHEMCQGSREQTVANMSIAISGIAGPSGGTEQKPVGTVYIGVSLNENTRVELFNFVGSRQEVRLSAVCEALNMALDILAN